MWASILFLLIVTAAAVENEDRQCYFQVVDKCIGDLDDPLGLPGTEEELEDFCKFFMAVAPCIYDGLDNCDNSEHDRAYIQDVISNIPRVCDEDSLLHTALIEHLECLDDMEDLQLVCTIFPEEKYESFAETLAGIGITEIAAPDSEPNKCLVYLYRFGCIAAHVGKSCNDVARGVIIDLTQGFDSLLASCRPGMKDNLLAIAKVMQAEQEKMEEVEEK